MAEKTITITICTLANLLAYISVAIGSESEDIFDSGMIALCFEFLLFLISCVMFFA